MNFADRLCARVEAKRTCATVGIDPHLELLPEEFAAARDPQLPRARRAERMGDFCCALLELVAPLVPAVKPQSAFFEALGADGALQWERVVRRARELDLLVIGDVKRGDIGSTARAYAAAFLEGAGEPGAPVCDAVTLSPFLGSDSIEPFLEACARTGAGAFVLVRTSNPGSADFQRLGSPELSFAVAERVARWGERSVGRSGFSSIGAVVGATHAGELAAFRAALPRAPFLLPGYGAQGASAADLRGAFAPGGRGVLVNSSRGIAFAYKEAGRGQLTWQQAAVEATRAMIADLEHAVGGAMTRAEVVPFEALGVEGLVQALLERPGAIPGFVVARELADIPEPADAFTREERAALSSALQGRLAALSPHVAVLDSLRSLGEPRASVVIAGQQPGFLASPLYNVHKALHAVRLARTLSGAWERPVVPMFWNHADDHDLAEVNHAFVANENLDLQKVALAGLSSGRQPYSRVVLQGEAQRLGAIRATLEELCRGEPHAREALDVLVPRDGESLARAFTRSMTELFGAFGLVVLEPDWIRPALSQSLAGLLAKKSARGSAQSFEQALELGAAEVRALGHAPQIDPASAAILYRVDDNGRSALRAGGDGLRYDGESGSRTREELAAEIVQDPLAWSPAALTRAIAQDACLPVAAYVGGLGELAYHAQLGPLRDFAGVPRTPFVARFSCTLIEPEVAESLAKLELSAEHVLRRAGALETGPDASAPAVIAALREIAARAAREIAAQREELAQVDVGLAANLKRTGEQMRSLVEKLCEKAERVHANRTGKGQRHARRVSNALMPRGLPQERVLGPLPFLARYGRGFLEDLFERVPALPREHLLVRLGEPPKESP